MASIILDRAVGLYTATNPLSATPPGALVLANNVVIRHDGLIEPRPGFSPMPNTTETAASGWTSGFRIVDFLSYSGVLITVLLKTPTGAQLGECYLRTAGSGSTNSLMPGTVWSGTVILRDGYIGGNLLTKMRTFEARGSLFMTSGYGMQKMCMPDTETVAVRSSFATPDFDSVGEITRAGVVKPMGTWLGDGAGSTGATAYSQVAYRTVLGYYDERGNEILGEPSERRIYINATASPISVGVRAIVPNVQYIDNAYSMPDTLGVTTGHFLRLYRTKNSGGANIDPGDDCYLVKEFSFDPSLADNSIYLNNPTADRDVLDVSIPLGGVNDDTLIVGDSGNINEITSLTTFTSWNGMTQAESGLSGVNWRGVACDSAGTACMVVGEYGKSALVVTTSGTPIATEVSTGTTNDLNAVARSPSSAVFWAVGEGGTILYYSGGSWAAQTSGVAVDLNDVYAISATEVYAVGNTGTVLRTTNAGTTWTALTITGSPTTNLYGVSAYDTNNVCVVGDSAFIRHYTGGGAGTWTNINQSATVTGNLYAVAYAFTDDSVWVGGDAGKIWWNDGGAANISAGGVDGDWNNNSYPVTYSGHTIYALDARTVTDRYVVAVGSEGLVARGQRNGADPQAGDWARSYPPMLTNYNAQVMYFDDETPDVSLGPPLYTNVALDGITQANTPPPPSHDVVYWNDRAWYVAQRESTPNVIFSLQGTSAVAGTAGSLDADDYLVICDASTAAGATSGLTIQLGSSANELRGVAAVSTAAGTVSQNIKNTLMSIADTINLCSRRILFANKLTDSGYWSSADTTATINWGEYRADYIEDESGGFLVISNRRESLNTNPVFYVITSDPTAFTPTISAEPASTDFYRNRLYYSKLRQPEAVPRLNYLDVGKTDSSILRVVGMGDRLYVFKEDGVFTVSGGDFFQVNELDRTVVLYGINTPAVLGNKIFALTNQGVVAVNESGVAVLSAPIADQISVYTGRPANLSGSDYFFQVGCYGVADDYRHLYILGVPDITTPYPDNHSDAKMFFVCTKAFVYNAQSRAWTTWEKSRIDSDTGDVASNACGWYAQAYFNGIGSTALEQYQNALLASDSESTRILMAIERTKNTTADVFNFDNYVTKTPSAVSSGSNTLTFSASDAEEIAVGDMLSRGVDLTATSNTNYGAIVTAVDSGSGVVTVKPGSSFTFSVASYYVYKAIDCQIQYVDVMPDKDSKHFSSATYIFKRRGFYSAYSQMGGEWQNFGGGETVTRSELIFSDRVVKASRGTLGVHASSKRVLVPKEVQRGSYLSVGLRVKEAGAYWALAGIGIETEGGSDRNNR